VPLTAEGRIMMESFGRSMQDRQRGAGPLLGSALGKARGQALRLALVLELLWWCGDDGVSPPPNGITPRAFMAAAGLISDYFIPIAERIYGSHTLTPRDGNAAKLARWILVTRAAEVHIRHLQREVCLPGLRTAAQIREAAEILVASSWLSSPARNTQFGPRARVSYTVNSRLRLATISGAGIGPPKPARLPASRLVR
jgi:hypothetical protein